MTEAVIVVAPISRLHEENLWSATRHIGAFGAGLQLRQPMASEAGTEAMTGKRDQKFRQGKGADQGGWIQGREDSSCSTRIDSRTAAQAIVTYALLQSSGERGAGVAPIGAPW